MRTAGSGRLGMAKHRKGGHTVNAMHFTGPKVGKRVRRKGKGLSRKQRRMKRHSHVSKY